MDNIKKLPSGFYALFSNTGNVIDAALIPWDGTDGSSDYKYDCKNDSFEYYIAADKTVYYTKQNGADANIWCIGSRLRHHLHDLERRLK